MRKGLKLLSLIVFCMFVLSVVAGCGQGNTDKGATTAAATTEAATTAPAPSVYAENGLPMDGEVTLKVGFWESGYGKEWFDYATQTFSQKFPNVKFDVTSSPTVTEVIKTKLAAGNDDDMFDICYYGWAQLAKEGKVEPLTDLWDRAPYDVPDKKLKDVAIAGLVDSLQKYNGELYYMPLTTAICGLFFDQALFDENGWNKSPKTWDEFLALCEAIKAKGIAPITYAGVYDYESFVFDAKRFEIAAMNGNADYVKNDLVYAAPYYTSPENLERWKRQSELGKKGYFADGIVGMNHTQSQMMAIQHKAAMVISGDWIENEMKDSTPEGFKWGYMDIPFINQADQTQYVATNPAYTLIVYSKKPDLNKKWAKEFLLWLTTMDVQKSMVEKGGALSMRSDYLDDATRAAALKSSQKSIFEYMSSHKVQLVNIWTKELALTHPSYGKATKLVMDNNGLMSLGKKDYTPILEEAETLIQEAVAAAKAEAK